MDPPDRFRQHRANVDRFDLVTLHLLDLMWNGVGHDNLSETKGLHSELY